MSTAVRFQRRGDIYEVSCPYDPRMVAVIKALPSSVRSWDPAAKVWKVDVDGGYARALAANLRELGYIVVGLAEPPPREPPRSNGRAINGDQWAHVLFRQVGPDRREPVFRALTRILHPDNQSTGDNTLQRQLNDAYGELRGDRR